MDEFRRNERLLELCLRGIAAEDWAALSQPERPTADRRVLTAQEMRRLARFPAVRALYAAWDGDETALWQRVVDSQVLYTRRTPPARLSNDVLWTRSRTRTRRGAGQHDAEDQLAPLRADADTVERIAGAVDALGRLSTPPPLPDPPREPPAPRTDRPPLLPPPTDVPQWDVDLAKAQRVLEDDLRAMQTPEGAVPNDPGILRLYDVIEKAVQMRRRGNRSPAVSAALCRCRALVTVVALRLTRRANWRRRARTRVSFASCSGFSRGRTQPKETQIYSNPRGAISRRPARGPRARPRAGSRTTRETS